MPRLISMLSCSIRQLNSPDGIENLALTKTICQLGFPCGQQSPQPATAASGFDRKATRNPQLHIVPSVSNHCPSIFQYLSLSVYFSAPVIALIIAGYAC